MLGNIKGLEGVLQVSGNRISIIGLGLLGSALSRRLLQGGFQVSGYDLAAENRERLTSAGGVAAGSAGEAVKLAPITLLSLPNSEIAASVVEEIVAAEVRNIWVLDTTTGSPEASEAMADRLAAFHCHYADLTIAGSSREVAAGEAVAMFGGSPEEIGQLEPLLRCLARQTFATGKPGNAARMKLVSNLALGLHRAVLAEALVFAQNLGLDARAALEILRATSSYSRVMDVKGGKMVEGDFSPDARLRQHLKDVRLMEEQALRHGAPIPLTHAHRALLERGEAMGLGDLDNSSILRVYEGLVKRTPDKE